MKYQEWLDEVNLEPELDAVKLGNDVQTDFPDMIVRNVKVRFRPAGNPLAVNFKVIPVHVIDSGRPTEEVRFTDGKDPRPTSAETPTMTFDRLVTARLASEGIRCPDWRRGRAQLTTEIVGYKIDNTTVEEVWSLNAAGDDLDVIRPDNGVKRVAVR